MTLGSVITADQRMRAHELVQRRARRVTREQELWDKWNKYYEDMDDEQLEREIAERERRTKARREIREGVLGEASGTEVPPDPRTAATARGVSSATAAEVAAKMATDTPSTSTASGVKSLDKSKDGGGKGSDV